MSDFLDVGLFHEKMGLPNTACHPPEPRPIDPAFIDFRVKFMDEEVQEFVEAANRNDHAGMLDALIDLTWVAMGTAHQLGYPWGAAWALVYQANMLKQRAPTAVHSKRNSSFDVIKPAGWQPPDIAGLLRSFGWAIAEEHDNDRDHRPVPDAADHG